MLVNDHAADCSQGANASGRTTAGDSGAEPTATELDPREIVLLCNPRAGGKWRELAEILDSDEAGSVRRIVTDSIEDVAPALDALTQHAKVLCVYGGDGTIQRILDRLYADARQSYPQLAFVGGGTMNVVARWCGMTSSPANNFRRIVRAYRSGQLLLKEVPLLRVRMAQVQHLGFTVGLGPLVRLLAEFERTNKKLWQLAALLSRTIAGAWGLSERRVRDILAPMRATVHIDGTVLPRSDLGMVFCNTTGHLFLATDPFVKRRQRDNFHVAAYATTAREFTLLMPFLARGWLPLDPAALRTPVSTWKRIGLTWLGHDQLPTDPRFVNDTAKEVRIDTDEKLITVDGELIHTPGGTITVELGPTLQLAVSPTVDLGPTIRLAAAVADKAQSFPRR